MIYIYNIKWHNTFIIKMLHTEIDALIKRLGIHGKLTEGFPPRKATQHGNCIIRLIFMKPLL